MRLVVLLLFLVPLSCARSGYEDLSAASSPLVCDAPQALSASCDDACVCLNALACDSGVCVVPSGSAHSGGGPCNGATCSSHGTCVLLSTGPDLYGCACDQGYTASGTSCVQDGCVASGVTVNRCEQNAVRSFDSCGAEVGVVQACTNATCGAAGGGVTCIDPKPAGDFCCIAPVCGNGVIEGDEVCDSAATPSCTELGGSDGTTSCSADCKSINLATCNNICGNRRIEGDEACDGPKLPSDPGVQCQETCIGARLVCSPQCVLGCQCDPTPAN